MIWTLHDLATYAIAVLSSLAVWAVKEAYAARKTRRERRLRESAVVAKAEIESRAAREQRLDEKAETLFEQYDRRITDLEQEVEGLKAELRVERQQRRLAEMTAEAAQIRADQAEARLAHLKNQMQLLTEERDRLARLAEQQRSRIADLMSQIA